MACWQVLVGASAAAATSLGTIEPVTVLELLARVKISSFFKVRFFENFRLIIKYFYCKTIL